MRTLWRAGLVVGVVVAVVGTSALAVPPTARPQQVYWVRGCPTCPTTAPAPPPPHAVADVPVVLDAPAQTEYRLSYATRDGSAHSPGDFTAVRDGVVVIPAGRTVGYARVEVNPGPEEVSFEIVYSAPSEGTLAGDVTRVLIGGPPPGG